MNIISTFLERFKKLSPPQSIIKTAFINAVRSQFKIEVLPEQVRIQRDTIFFQGNPLFKTEMTLKKKELLAKINEELKLFSRRVSDIR